MMLKEDSKALLSAFTFPGHLQMLWLNMNKVFPHVSFPLILPLSSDISGIRIPRRNRMLLKPLDCGECFDSDETL